MEIGLGQVVNSIIPGLLDHALDAQQLPDHAKESIPPMSRGSGSGH